MVAAALALVALTAGSAGVAAQSTGDFDRGWHIVRPGDNLHSITRQYLGNALLWRENWRLNPQIEDPNVLTPGQRIEVLVERQQSVPTARLRSVAGAVEEKPAPISWNPAREQDLLLEEDGLRTGGKASTEMEFQDGTRVLMTEDSIVYLRRQGRRLTGVPPRSVEIVEGQAEVAAQRPPGSEDSVEILVGGTRAVSTADESGVAQTRARHAEGGGAKVMVYEGGGEVEASGEKVAVGRGMGTSVDAGRPPAPPEKLLPAPAGLRPEPESRLQFNNIDFAWQPVAGAASYTVELCLDAECVRLVDRQLALVEPAWQPAPLPRGDYFWRVTAVSVSGLDGYPSAGARLAVLADGPDVSPPSGRLIVGGRQLHRRGRLIVDEAVEIEPQLEDAGSGVAGWRPVIDGSEVDSARWRGPWPDGSYRVTVVAVDRVGNEARLPTIDLVVDAEAPDLSGRGLAGGESVPWRGFRERWFRRGREPGSGLSTLPPRLRRRWLRRGHDWLEVSADGRTWQPWTVPGSELCGRLVARRWPHLSGPLVVNADEPRVLIRSANGSPLRPPASGAAPAEILLVRAADTGVGVERLELRLDEVAAGEFAIWAEATDAFGHRTQLSWSLTP